MEELEIYKWFITQNPIIQALYAGLFTWGLTALGAALVFLMAGPATNMATINVIMKTMGK